MVIVLQTILLLKPNNSKLILFKRENVQDRLPFLKNRDFGRSEMEREILKLGDPKLYEVSRPVSPEEREGLAETIRDLHDTLLAYRKKYGAGRAIAAPQIGVAKRLIYLYVDEPVVFVNPSWEPAGKETMEVMDDCMSFPGLLVKVRRFRKIRIRYQDREWNLCEQILEGDLAELLQHEYDHLDGILATMRAVDERSFYWKEAGLS